MKQAWQNVNSSILDLQAEIEQLLTELPTSTFYRKKQDQINRIWNKLSKQINAFDEYITPIKPIGIKSPWDDKEFWETWQFWIEYLNEQHGFIMRSRMQKIVLEELKAMSENNPKTAVRYIRFAISGGYNKIFKVNEPKENQSDESKESKKPTTFAFRLPVRESATSSN